MSTISSFLKDAHALSNIISYPVEDVIKNRVKLVSHGFYKGYKYLIVNLDGILIFYIAIEKDDFFYTNIEFFANISFKIQCTLEYAELGLYLPRGFRVVSVNPDTIIDTQYWVIGMRNWNRNNSLDNIDDIYFKLYYLIDKLDFINTRGNLYL